MNTEANVPKETHGLKMGFRKGLGFLGGRSNRVTPDF